LSAGQRRSVPTLEAAFYARSAREVARALVGTVLRSDIDGETVTGRIVETEAYIGPHDPASHAAERHGRTARNASMFGPPGIAYVYRSYGVHWCLNVVTDRLDFPAAVLIRAVEPLQGLDVMARRRGTGRRDLTRGPGRLTQAFGITGELDGHPLDRPPLTLHPAPAADDGDDLDIGVGPRVGITRAADWPLRFWLRDSMWVSR
jgi:DNA-3-methyladenine glycosylase